MRNAARLAVVGGGPAGLMAATCAAAAGINVDIYDAMPSLGRKFLMAGKSGLNITHAEPEELFRTRYIDTAPAFERAIQSFGPRDVRAFMEELGIEAFTGSTGHVFPKAMKASPMLRAWLRQLGAAGVKVHLRHRLVEVSALGDLVFETPAGRVVVSPDAVVFALGGGSWARLGSDGRWAQEFAARGIGVVPFEPSNGGFIIPWSAHMRENFAGVPVKAVRLTVNTPDGPYTTRGEFVITAQGVEGGGVYTLSAPLRRQLRADGTATLHLDLVPDIALARLAESVARPAGKQSLSNHLRKVAHLSPVKLALMREGIARPQDLAPNALAAALKAVPIRVVATAEMDRAISTAGGVSWAALDDHFMLRAVPGHFCAGEMLAWDAPTGGYLLTGALATGRAAAFGAVAYLAGRQRAD